MGRPAPLSPSSPLCLLPPQTFPLPRVGCTFDLASCNLVDVAALGESEVAEQTTHLSKRCPTRPHFASSEACCPEPSPEPSRPSPWCQLPASVFPAAPGSGSYSCPRAEGQLCKDPEPAPRAQSPPVDEELGPPSACPRKELRRSLSEFIYPSPPACPSSGGSRNWGPAGTKGEKEVPGVGQGACSVGLQ